MAAFLATLDVEADLQALVQAAAELRLAAQSAAEAPALLVGLAAPVMWLRSAPSKVTARCRSAVEVEPGPPLKKNSVFSVSPSVERPHVTAEKSAPALPSVTWES